MEYGVALVRLLLAAVLTVSGSAKLADVPGVRRTFIGFGGPAALAPIAGWLLPIAELVVALALVSDEGARAGGIAALGLFLLFTVVLGAALARRRSLDCHCFGPLSASPVSWTTLARTGALAGMAGFLVYGDRSGAAPGVASRFAALPPSGLASAAAVLAAVGAASGLLAWARESRRREAALLERVEALEHKLAEHPGGAGAAATAEAPDEGLPVGAHAAGHGSAGRPALLLFVSSSCPPCRALLPEVAAWRDQLGAAADVVVTSRDDAGGRTLAEAFRARWTPAGVLVGRSGRIVSPVRYGSDGVTELFEALRASLGAGHLDERALHRRLGSRLGSSTVMVGEPWPAREVLDADGRERLLLFWDPGCSYCQGMAGELEAFEATRQDDAPTLTFVVPRDADAAREAQERFSSPTFYDPGSRVAPLFGGRGTPAAVLVDRHGAVASTVAVGKDAILSLLAPADVRSLTGA